MPLRKTHTKQEAVQDSVPDSLQDSLQSRFFARRKTRRDSGSGRQRDCARCDAPAVAMVEKPKDNPIQSAHGRNPTKPHSKPHTELGGTGGTPLPLCGEHLAAHNQAQIAAVAGTANWNAVLTQDAVWNRPTWPAGNPSRMVRQAEDFASADPQAAATGTTTGTRAGTRAKTKGRNFRHRTTGRTQAEAQALATLGLDDSATPAQIRRRYRRLIKKLHPDAGARRRTQATGTTEAKDTPDPEEQLRAINSAWQELKPLLSERRQSQRRQ